MAFSLGGLVTGTGYFGTLIFGIIKRALIPFGLHHVFYMPFWQTAVGGTMMVDGNLIQGGQNIFFAQLASSDVTHFSADATRYFSGEFIFMIFGLPGAALAMYRCAKPEKKKAAGGLLLSAALACMFTGITEPIEFSFLFVAPMLFCSSGDSGRKRLYGCAYFEHCSWPYIFRWSSGSGDFRCASGQCENQLASHHSCWNCVFPFCITFCFSFLIKNLI